MPIIGDDHIAAARLGQAAGVFPRSRRGRLVHAWPPERPEAVAIRAISRRSARLEQESRAVCRCSTAMRSGWR